MLEENRRTICSQPCSVGVAYRRSGGRISGADERATDSLTVRMNSSRRSFTFFSVSLAVLFAHSLTVLLSNCFAVYNLGSAIAHLEWSGCFIEMPLLNDAPFVNPLARNITDCRNGAARQTLRSSE